MEDPQTTAVVKQAQDRTPDEVAAYEAQWSRHVSSTLPGRDVLGRIAYEVHHALTPDATPFDELTPEARDEVLAHLDSAMGQLRL